MVNSRNNEYDPIGTTQGLRTERVRLRSERSAVVSWVLAALAAVLSVGCALVGGSSAGSPTHPTSDANKGPSNDPMSQSGTENAETDSAPAVDLAGVPAKTQRRWTVLVAMWERLGPRSDAEEEFVRRATQLCLDAESLRTDEPKLTPLVEDYQREVCSGAVSAIPSCWASSETRSRRDTRCGEVTKLDAAIVIDTRLHGDTPQGRAASAAIADDLRERRPLADLNAVEGKGCEALPPLEELFDRLSAEEQAQVANLANATSRKGLSSDAPGAALAGFNDQAETAPSAPTAIAVALGRVRIDIYEDAARLAKGANAKRDPKLAADAAERFACLGAYSDAEARHAAALKAEMRISAALLEEARCRADPKCRATWVAEDLCGFRDFRAQVRADIAEEKRYGRRVGVVNLTELQELKEMLRTIEGRIAELKQEYRELSGSAFSTKLCS